MTYINSCTVIAVGEPDTNYIILTYEHLVDNTPATTSITR